MSIKVETPKINIANNVWPQLTDAAIQGPGRTFPNKIT